MAEPVKTKVERFFEAWADSLAALLSQVGGAEWTPQPTAKLGEYAPVAALRVGLQGGLNGLVWLSVSTADAGQMLQSSQGEPGSISGPPDEAQWEALSERFRRWAALAGIQLQPTFGEVAMTLTAEPETRSALSSARLLRAASKAAAISVRMDVDADLLSGLDRRQRPRAEFVPEGGVADLEKLLREGNFNLLLDVELGVTLRFGSRRAPLREVLELSPGVVLELNREIQDPVDLLLNERVIARGDVVVVDGNYGLHITEIISPAQPEHNS